MKISVKISLPTTEVQKMYLYICICLYINILHFPPNCQQMYALVCINGLYFVHTLKFQSFGAARILLQLWLKISNENTFLAFVLTLKYVLPFVHSLFM